MTDIYIHRGSPRRRWLIGGLILAGLLLLAAPFVFQRDATEPEPEEPSVIPEPEITEPVTVSAPTATPATIPDDLPDLNSLMTLVESNQWQQARELAFERLEGLPEGAARLTTEILLGDLHTRMVLEKVPMPEKTVHVVSQGDTLGKLAQEYGTTPELIAISNGIERNVIRLGESLRILTGSFEAVVNKTRNDLVLTLDGRFFKRYRVGTGTHSSTPEGDYEITLRLKHPVWYRPDGEQFPYGHPENLLGTHYLKLNTPGIGLHGTWEPETVGFQSSAGCVRLENDLIEELYNLLPVGTPVRIENGS